MGAKRYCTVKGGKLQITVAGVPKDTGSAYLAAHGGIEAFDFNLVFPGSETEKLGASYDDEINEIREVDGHRIHITRNVTLVSCDYYMTLYYSYRQILDQAEAFLDKYDHSDYNKRW